MPRATQHAALPQPTTRPGPDPAAATTGRAQAARGPRPGASLARRIVLATLVGLAAGLAAAGWFGTRALAHAEAEARVSLADAADAAARQAGARIAVVEQALQVLATAPAIADGRPGCGARLARLRQALGPAVESMVLSDAGGVVRCAAPEALIGQAVPDGLGQAPRTALADPGLLRISLPAGPGASGLASAALRVGGLADGLDPGTRDVALWLADGTGRRFPLSARARANGRAPPSPALLPPGTAGGVQAIDAPGGRQLVAMQPVTPALAVLAARPADALQHEALRLGLLALVPALAALLAALGAILLVLRRSVLAPLQAMAVGLAGPPAANEALALDVPRELAAVWARISAYRDAAREREARLTDALVARARLVHELHHRTKNNLQIISSLLALQERRSADAATAATLHSARERVAALAAMHQQFHAGQALDRIELPRFLTDLVGGIGAAAEAGARGIRLCVEAEPIALPIDEAAPVGLIINELVTNSLRHGFPGRAGGTVRVSARRLGAEVELVVADDGIGIAAGEPGTEPAEVDPPTGRLGGLLLQAFARQLGGRLVRRQGQGTAIALTFPLATAPATPAPSPPGH